MRNSVQAPANDGSAGRNPTNLTAITAEGATLPVIRAAGFEARVNAYVVGRTERTLRTGPHRLPNGETTASRSPGCPGGATDLWYLSLVAPRGHGTTLRAIWANLVGNTRHAVWLEGIGMVALGHQRLDLSGAGGPRYPLHWTYRQAIIPPSRDVQGVLESDLLTCYDPLLAPVVTRASRPQRIAGGKQGNEQAPGSARSERSAMTLTSAASAASSQGNQGDETSAREEHQLFLLLARSHSVAPAEPGDQANTAFARLHLRYLAARVPWLPYYPTWADFLWRRALAHGEAEPLHVWSYGTSPTTPPGVPGELVRAIGHDEPPSVYEAHTAQDASYLAAAYLCRPNPLALTADLSQAIATGMLRSTEPSAVPVHPDVEAERAA